MKLHNFHPCNGMLKEQPNVIIRYGRMHLNQVGKTQSLHLVVANNFTNYSSKGGNHTTQMRYCNTTKLFFLNVKLVGQLCH
jgi:hypothetical protein